MNTGFAGLALAMFATASALTGCVSLGDSSDTPAAVYYVLNDAAPAAAAPAVQPPVTVTTLRVLDTTTGRFYDTERLVFSRSADTRGHYQFARWTERPGRRFADLMRTRLDHQGIWSVSAGDGYVGTDWLLDTELIEFYHDAASNPGQVRLVLRADLVDTRQRKLLGRRVFEHQVVLESYDAAGAAQASSQAVSRVLDDLTAWLAGFK
jgi:cholesterol transport system auxiliary component